VPDRRLAFPDVGVRDRFFTPTTAKAIMSWRILVGLGAGIALGLAGLPVAVAVVAGAAVYAGSVAAAMPRPKARPSIDPFTLSEPWRRLIQQAQGSGRRMREAVSGVAEGPLRRQLDLIADQLDHGLEEAWQVARRGDEIDDMVRNLDPTRLRSKLQTLHAEAGDAPSPDTAAAIASVEQQLATAERLKQQSAETADSLRRNQTRLDELVARASEVRVGAADTDTYARDVDELVIKLEALRQAIQEIRTA